MTTIRQLTAELGFSIDTTPLRQFNKSLSEVKKSINSLKKPSSSLTKTIGGSKKSVESLRSSVAKFGVNINKVRGNIGKLKTGVSALNTTVKKTKTSIAGALSKGLKKGSKDFNLDDIKNKLKKEFKAIKKSALIAGAAIAASIATSLKLFKSFSSEEQAVEKLKFQLQDAFDGTNIRIDEAIKNTDDLATRLDLLNAAAASFEIDTNPEAFNESLESAIKFSAVLGKDVVDISQLFAQFRAFGDVEGLKSLGLFTSQQLEVLKKAGTELTAVGQTTRTKELTRLLSRDTPRLDKAFESFSKTATAAVDKLGVAAAETARVLGEDAAPIIKDAAIGLTKDLNTIRANIKSEGGLFQGLLETAKNQFLSDIRNTFEKDKPIVPISSRRADGTVTTLFTPETTITIIGNPTQDTIQQISDTVENAGRKNGAILQQNNNSLLIRGQNQVP